MTKMEETTYYVVNTADDGSDTYAVKFDDKAEAEKYLRTEQYNFRERELLTEKEFWATWSKPADAYANEEDASQDGYVWDDQHNRWTNIDDIVKPGLIFFKGLPKSLQFTPLD